MASRASSDWRKLQRKHLCGYDPYATGEGYTFDVDAADRFCGLFSFLTLIEGEKAGQPFHLEPWQRAIVGAMYGWKSDKTGLRRYREAFIYVPR